MSKREILFCSCSERCGGKKFHFPVNIALNKLCPEQSHWELLSRASGVQSLYCKLLRALGEPSFICMTVFRIINFILYVLQLAELVAPPWLFLSSPFPSLLVSSCFTADNLTQTHPPRFTVLELHVWLPFCSLFLYPSITASLTHTLSSPSFRHLRVLCWVPPALALGAVTCQRRRPVKRLTALTAKLSPTNPFFFFTLVTLTILIFCVLLFFLSPPGISIPQKQTQRCF